MAPVFSPTTPPAVVTLHGVSFALPDGCVVLQGLCESFAAAERVGVIGRNGTGKSTLGRLVAGLLPPSSGRIQRLVPVRHVDQQVGAAAQGGLARLAGLEGPLQACERLARGDGTVADVEAVGDRWDLPARWRALLEQAGLWALRDRAEALSGGQRVLAALLGAFCSDAGLLVLDEPSNHLDRNHRALLVTELDRWQQAGRGVVLISHDRDLLERVDRTVELGAHGVQRYGGGWPLVQRQRDAAVAAAAERLQHAQVERRRAQAALAEAVQRQARRDARGGRLRRKGSQPALVLNARAEQAQHTGGKVHVRRAHELQRLQEAVSQACTALGGALERPSFPASAPADRAGVPAGRVSLLLEGLVPPFGWTAPLTWVATGPVRVAVCGPNGCGKSTLLRLIAGGLQPRQGRCGVPQGPVAGVDQSLAVLDPAVSALEQLQRRTPGLAQGTARQWLAQAGMGAQQALRPCGTLSSGEQLRAALLCAVAGPPMARVLLLDEPTNHLDLHAVQALESMLQSWQGVLVVASHDAAFLQRLGLTHRLEREGEGWQVMG